MSITLAYPAFQTPKDGMILIRNAELETEKAGTRRLVSHLTRNGTFKTVAEHEQLGHQTFLSTLHFTNIREEDIEDGDVGKTSILTFLVDARNHYVLYTDHNLDVWIIQILNSTYDFILSKSVGRWEITLNILRWAQ